MALVKGTNCGFVTEAPTEDPGTDFSGDDVEARALASKDTSPATAVKITEIGWYCVNATEAANFEVGIYDHNVGDDEPEAVVGALDQTNAKGTGAGWKRVTGLDITIDPSTIYWIAIEVDNTSTTTKISYNSVTGRRARKINQTSLADPWGASENLHSSRLLAIYAVWEAAPTPPVAAFSGTPTSGEAPLTVQFTDTSTNTPTSWLWDFGDTTGSILENPENIYASAGDFTVTLTATNDDGSDDEEKTDYITVTAPPAVVAEVKKTGKRHFRWQEEEEEKPKPKPKPKPKVNIPVLSHKLRGEMDDTLRRLR